MNEPIDNNAIDALRNELSSKIDWQTHQLAIELRQQTEMLGDKLNTIANALIAGAAIIIGSLIVLIPMIYRKLEVFVE